MTTLFLLIWAAGLVAGFLLYSRPGVMWSRHLLRIGTARRWGAVLLWISSLGMFFFTVGWLQINPFTFGERIWMYLTLLAAIIAVALILVQIRTESAVLSHERRLNAEAVAKGIHTRRPPRRSANRKR
jgi:hypothetical protein